jgi:hypothetical protein
MKYKDRKYAKLKAGLRKTKAGLKKLEAEFITLKNESVKKELIEKITEINKKMLRIYFHITKT